MFIFKHEFNFNAFLLYFFYCANVPPFFNIVLPLLGHYWSLGVEEQFYLFWPWIIKKVKKNTFWFIAILALALMVVKMMVYILYPQSALTTVLLMSRFHCMMIGGMGAMLYKKQHQLFLRVIDNKLMQLACWTVVVLSAINKFHVASLVDNEIISIVTVFLIVGQINTRNRIVNLENAVFNFLGRISYGIYVFHPLVIFYYSIVLKKVLPPSPLSSYLFVYAMILGTTILAAYLSFNYFEKHFLRLKEKYVAVSSTNILGLKKI
jgi:peptidoglycan/LPS O-acetylase OafA/YrhL